MKKGKNSYFWTSYSDLMTSLFFVMLVLFALATIMLKEKNDKIEKDKNATELELEKIKKVEASTKDLEGKYFTYDSDYEKFKLNIECKFATAKFLMSDIQNPGALKELESAGKEIEKFFKLHNDNQYLLIIEGQASYDNDGMTWNNYELSYKRAAALAVYWQKECKLNFGPKCELQIAGSGDGRFNPNSMRDADNVKNQRFLIYIIPKNILNKN